MRYTRKCLTSLLLMFILPSFAWVKGIYITQPTLENTKTITHLISQAKAVGINTFVVDYSRRSTRYAQNIQLVKNAGLNYVARIVMFPEGAHHAQVISKQYLAGRHKLIQEAVALGANEIQLDYIRYKATQRPSPENVNYIFNVIKSVRDQLKGSGVKLQIDIFGVAASQPSHAIGQDPSVFASAVNAICPMVYPSHYEPFHVHAEQPYKTVYKSLVDLRENIRQYPDVKIYAYIELFNYRYPMSYAKKVQYIKEQIRATLDSHANGYYFWSARNKYGILFSVLAKN